MLNRLSLSILLVLATLLPASLFAMAGKATVPVTCSEAIEMADGADRDWRTDGGDANFYFIDGSRLTDMDMFRDALIAAKQRIPLVHGGNFSAWDFRNLSFGISGVCFDGSDLSHSRWEGANIFGNGYVAANLSGARFDDVQGQHVLLREANLDGTVMRGADLSNGRLDGGWDGILSNWDLTGANMQHFRFDCGITVGDGCSLDRDGVKFTGANMRGADIATLPFWGQADYSGTVLTDATISPRQLPDLKRANFIGNNILAGGKSTVQLNAAQMKTLAEQAALAASDNDRASFDCAKAASNVEKMICGEYRADLRKMDRQLADLYSYIRPKNPGIADSQKAWLAKRGKCIEDDCVFELYESRIDELAKLLGEIDILQPGEQALFLGDAVPFPASFTDDPLYARIIPVLVGAAMQEAVLTRNKNGTYTIFGSSIGANAHMCDLQGDGASYDARTGWFSIDGVAIFRMIGDDLVIVGNGHPDEQQFPESGNYVGCGVRALFSPMRRINADPKLVRAELRAMTQNQE